MATQPNVVATRDMLEDIIQRVEQGETLRSIMLATGTRYRTVQDQLARDPDLWERFEQARIAGGHAIADEALAIVEEPPPKVDGKIDPGHVQWARLRADTRLKLLAKWFPQQYGDKTLLAGHDGGALKIDQRHSVKELVAQLHQMKIAIGSPAIEHKALDNESECFTGDGVSNDSEQEQCTSPGSPQSKMQSAPLRALSSNSAASEAMPQSTSAAAPTGQLMSSAAVPAGAYEPAAPAAGQGASSAAIGGRKRRARGTGQGAGGDLGGGPPDVDGTPTSEIFTELPTNHNETNNLQFPPEDDWSPEDYV